MQDTPKLLSPEEFFKTGYRAVAMEISRLGPRLAAVRDSVHLTVNIDPILAGMIALCKAAHEVLQMPPVWPAETSIATLLQALECTAQLTGTYMANVTIHQAADQIRAHSQFFENHFNIETDYASGSFGDNEKKQLFVALCLQTAQIILSNIMFVFKFASADPRHVDAFFDYKEIRETCPIESLDVLDKCRHSLEGWCTEDKAWLLYHLVRQEKPENAVEIGIYGGRSIVPIAQALRENGSGTVAGIEAWTSSAATEQVTDFANDFWWSCIDYDILKRAFLKFIIDHSLTRQIKIIEAPSNLAYHCIGAIDFLHIDGNHSAFSSSQDVVNYYSKLKSGGILVFDDINWPSTHPALTVVMKSSQLLYVTPVEEGSSIPGCAAFRKI